MERRFDKDAPDSVGSNRFNRCSPKGIGVPPSNIAVLVVDIARLRSRSPDFWALLRENNYTHIARTKDVSLGAGFRKTSHKSSLLPISDQRVQDLKPYGDLCM